MNLLFIHLNLCIALALGLVAFIAGIERATDNEVCVIHHVRTRAMILYKYSDGLQSCGSTVAIYIHICFLLDVV